MVRSVQRERSNVEYVLSREAEERGALAEIGRVIGSSLHINEVYEKFGELVRRLMPWDRITVVTVDMGAATERIAYVAGIPLTGLVPGTLESFDGNPVGDVVTKRTGLVLTRPLMERYSLLGPNLAGGLRSLLCVALIWRDQPIGALVLQSKQDDAYTSRELALGERVGAQIAGAIANAQLHDEVSRHAHERALIAEIGRVVASSIRVSDVDKEFSENVRRLLPFDRLEITTVDAGRGKLRTHYSNGDPGPGTGRHEWPVAGTLTEKVIQGRSGLIEHSGEHTYRQTGGAWRSILAVPLVARNEAIGALTLMSRQDRAYSSNGLALAEMIADQIAGSIANAELHADLLRTVDERAFVAELWRLARPGIEAADLCEAVAARLKPVLPYDHLIVHLPQEAATGKVVMFVAGAQNDRGVDTSEVTTLTQKAISSGRGMILEAMNEPARNSSSAARVLSGLTVPLVSENGYIGALHLQSFRTGIYSSRQLETAERIGEQVGRALALTGALAQTEDRPSNPGMHTERDFPWAWRVDPSGAGNSRPRPAAGHGAVSVLIVDRLSICRRGYAALFRNTGVEILGDATTLEQAADLLARHQPRLVLFEPHLADMASYDLLATLPLRLHGTRVLVVAESATPADVRAALRAGANGFLLKTVSPVGLINSAERVACGGTVIDPELLSGLVDDIASMPARNSVSRGDFQDKLSERDMLILGGLSRGQRNSEIASALKLSPGTVRNRLIRIYQVMGVTDRASAAHLATRMGLV